jgi:hypothetical protein
LPRDRDARPRVRHRPATFPSIFRGERKMLSALGIDSATSLNRSLERSPS